MGMNEKRKKRGLVWPKRERRIFVIRHWSENLVLDDFIFSMDHSIDSITVAPGTTICVMAKYAGGFILEQGGQLIAPNLVKCNSIILPKGAKAYWPSLRLTENGWFGENDYKRNGTISAGEDCLIDAPLVVLKLPLGKGAFLRRLPTESLLLGRK